MHFRNVQKRLSRVNNAFKQEGLLRFFGNSGRKLLRDWKPGHYQKSKFDALYFGAQSCIWAGIMNNLIYIQASTCLNFSSLWAADNNLQNHYFNSFWPQTQILSYYTVKPKSLGFSRIYTSQISSGFPRYKSLLFTT